MPQGNFKNRKVIQVPSKNKKSQNRSSLKLKKGKGISSKKTVMQESKKLKVKLEKAINAKIEEDVKAMASNEAAPLKILKSSSAIDGKKKKKS